MCELDILKMYKTEKNTNKALIRTLSLLVSRKDGSPICKLPKGVVEYVIGPFVNAPPLDQGLNFPGLSSMEVKLFVGH